MSEKKVRFPSIEENKFATPPIGWIQWKGTDVCMDIYCDCGEQFHIDASFCYFVRCLKCNSLYEVGGYVKLYKVEYAPEAVIQTDSAQEDEIEIEKFFIQHKE